MSDPSELSTEALARLLREETCPINALPSKGDVIGDVTPADPNVIDLMLDALVRAGRLIEERGFMVNPIRPQRRFVTKWREVDR